MTMNKWMKTNDDEQTQLVVYFEENRKKSHPHPHINTKLVAKIK